VRLETLRTSLDARWRTAIEKKKRVMISDAP
jgi:hypothetical protein